VSSRLLPRIGPRILIASGIGLGALGLLWFTRIGVHSAYLPHVFPAELVVALGMGLSFVPLNSSALTGVDEHDAGVASALVNTTQQIGGSMGTALLNTIAASSTATFLAAHAHAVRWVPTGLVHGYTTAFTVSAGLLAAGAVAAFALIRWSAPVGVSGATPGAPADGSVDEAPPIAAGAAHDGAVRLLMAPDEHGAAPDGRVRATSAAVLTVSTPDGNGSGPPSQ
jgi:hypothetical protein